MSPKGVALAALPSALPQANGFVALVADAPMAINLQERRQEKKRKMKKERKKERK